jgi:hypothetical protein
VLLNRGRREEPWTGSGAAQGSKQQGACQKGR